MLPREGSPCQNGAVDLDTLNALPEVDQHLFLRGRITSEAIALEAELRNLRVALINQWNERAFFQGDSNFSELVRQCRNALASRVDLENVVVEAIGKDLDEAERLYKLRNRYSHDLLIANQDATGYRLLRMDRAVSRTQPTPTSTEDMIGLVEELLIAWWRTYAAVTVVRTGDEGWREVLFAEVEGTWDGSMGYITEC